MRYIMGRCHACGGHVMYRKNSFDTFILCTGCGFIQSGTVVENFMTNIGRRPSWEELIVFIMCSEEKELFETVIINMGRAIDDSDEIMMFGRLLAEGEFHLLD